MTDSQNHPLSDDARVSPNRAIGLFAFVAVIALAAFGYVQMRSQGRDAELALEQAMSQNEELQKQMANLQATMADIKTANLYQQEEQTLAKDDISVILDRASSINGTIEELADAQTQWSADVDELKQNAIGRRIASDPALVDLLATILSTEPAKDASETLSQRLRPMLGQLRDALSDEASSFKPTEAFIQRIGEIDETSKKFASWYRDHLLELEAIKQQAESLQPAERTLRAALLSREADRAKERVEKLAARNREIQRQKDAMIGEAEAEAQRIIAEAEAEAKRMVGEATAARIRQAANEEKDKQEEAMRKRRAEEAIAQLKREYQQALPDIRVKLQPFITQGYTYNGDTGRKGPVSLAVLRGKGALEPGRKGLEKLLYVGGTTTNDRPRGAFPQYVGSEFAWRQLNKDFLVTAQDYIIKYGDLMVEQGLLAK